MKKSQNNKGITMVSLVVTIIVLIILAGISINLTLGDNGIITKAKQAKENIELAQVEEATRLNELYSEMNSEGSGSSNYDAIIKLEEFKSAIATAITNQGVETSSNATAETITENIGKILQARTSNATATAEDILTGKTAYVNGNLIVGNKADSSTMNIETITTSFSDTNTTSVAKDLTWSVTATFSQNISYAYISSISLSHASYSFLIESIDISENVVTITGNVSFGGQKTFSLSLDVVGLY